MPTGEEPPFVEPPWMEGINELGEVLEGISLALEHPERFTSDQLTALARKIEAAARQHGVYEPINP